MKTFKDFLAESADKFVNLDDYLEHERAEIEKAAKSLFKGFTMERYVSNSGANRVVSREYMFKFNRLPFTIRFTLVSDVGMYGKSGYIQKQSWAFMSPDAKNAKRATNVDVTPAKGGKIYAEASYSGTELKSIQVAKAYLKEVHKKVALSVKNSKFQHPDVQREYGADVVSRVFGAIA